jgi:leucyl-tRNA synthetase
VDAKFNISQKELEKLVLESEKIKDLIGKSEIKKIVFVPNKLINIVI